MAQGGGSDGSKCAEAIIAIKNIIAGLSYGNLGKNQKAIDDYTQALILNPQDAGAYYNLARILCLMDCKKHKTQIFENIEKAIKLNPKLKEKAKDSPAFKELHNNAEFRKLVGMD